MSRRGAAASSPRAPAATQALRTYLHLTSPSSLAHALTRETPTPYLRPRHVEYVSDLLVRATMGDPPAARIMVLMPPRHGKSQLVSRWYPTWLLAIDPALRVMLASYEFGLAAQWGREVRNTIREHYPELETALTADSAAQHAWRTQPPGGGAEGGMECVSVGSGVTGRGADVLIVDDVVKDAADAQSPTIQARNWDWWCSTWRSRLNYRGKQIMIVVGTPWDQDDLIGKLLAAHARGPTTEGYEDWQIVDLPALARPGDALGRRTDEPLWWAPAEYAAIKRSVGDYWWAAQYQGRPTPRGGDMIREAWWNYWIPAGQAGRFPPVIVDGRVCRIVELPAKLFQFQSWDLNFRDSVRAIEVGREPDPVAGHVWARGLEGDHLADMFLLDRFHGAVGFQASVDACRALSAKWPQAQIKIVEVAANGPALIATLQHELGGFWPATPRGTKTARALGSPTQGATEADRQVRAVGMVAAAQAGNLYLPHPELHQWAVEYRRLLGLFPRGGKDDTDATSQAWAWCQSDIWRDIEAAEDERREQEDMPKTTADLYRRQIDRAEAARGRDGLSIEGGTPYDRIRG